MTVDLKGVHAMGMVKNRWTTHTQPVDVRISFRVTSAATRFVSRNIRIYALSCTRKKKTCGNVLREGVEIAEDV